MSVNGDGDDLSLRQELVDRFGDDVLNDDTSAMEEDGGDNSELATEDGPLDFSATGTNHAVSSSSGDDDEDEEEEEPETNPLRRLIKAVSSLVLSNPVNA
jgi:hypothetical protein